MKIVIIGASNVGILLAQQLIAEGHGVSIIESNYDLAKKIAGELDCAVLHGDPVSPRVLGDAEVNKADYVVVVTGNDKDNLLAAINARGLGARNIIVVIENEDYHKLAVSLGFFNVVSLTRLAVIQIHALLKGMNIANLSTILRGDAIFYVAIVPDRMNGIKIKDMRLPSDSLIVAIYRGEELIFPKDDLEIKTGDEIVIFTRRQTIDELKKIFKH
ncbi:MAG: hypothetical protein DRO40_07460 [Thermoprotei archaeon]|nr:MAG: hypothetical protein DRO40_07460 [Thermoprotei archaeon]